MVKNRKNLHKIYAADVESEVVVESNRSQKAYALSSDGLAYRAHVYCVFNDPQFQTDIKILRQKIESLYYPNISLETSYLDEHILQEDRGPIKAVADKYRITLKDLGFYADGYFNIGYIGFGKDLYYEGGFTFLNPLETKDLAVYVLSKYTTLDDIRRDWPYIKEMMALKEFRKTDTKIRKRSPDNPTLIYAVFKMRLKKKTFREIYELYVQRQLPLFNGGNNQFNSEDSLERYFRKYSPETPDNDIDTTRNLSYLREIIG